MQWPLGKMSLIIAGQSALAVFVSLLLAFAPPAQGRMLLVPLDGQPISEELVRGLRATPLKPGPLEGSWVIEGERRSFSGLLLSKGIVVLAAPVAAWVTPSSSEEV